MKLKFLAAVLVGSQLVAACATMGSNGPSTAMDQAIRNCGLSIGAGILVGAIVGNNTGSGSAGDGALAGGLVGAGACAVFLAIANEQDRARIRELELAAVAANSRQSTRFMARNGRQVDVDVQVTEAELPAAAESGPIYTACRHSTTSLNVAGAGAASPGGQLWCRLETGDWEPVRN